MYCWKAPLIQISRAPPAPGIVPEPGTVEKLGSNSGSYQVFFMFYQS